MLGNIWEWLLPPKDSRHQGMPVSLMAVSGLLKRVFHRRLC